MDRPPELQGRSELVQPAALRALVQPSDALVLAQFAAVSGLAWPGRARWRLPGSIMLGAAGLTLVGGAVSFAAARRHGRHLTPRLEPPAAAQLQTGGPYAFSRHPVYAGLLLAASGAAVLRRRPEPLASALALAAVLHVKTGLEERHLARRFGPAYQEYARRTPRLVGLPRRG